MEKDLQQQQTLLWEFYKTWVSNHTQLSKGTKENDMYQLYEQLNLLLTNEINPAIHQTLTPTPAILKKIKLKNMIYKYYVRGYPICNFLMASGLIYN